jgi:hypothetical protein
MMFGGASLGSVALGSVLQDPGPITDPTSLRAITTELNGVRVFPQMDTLRIEDTLGQPVTASFTMISPSPSPEVGNQVRIFFHSQLIFGGTIDRVLKHSPDLLTFFYECDCLDWSQMLLRRQVRRNFTSMTVQSILNSLTDSELAGEPLTIGTIDSRVTIPLVDAQAGARAFDVCRTLAVATGQTFYVDFDGSIQMRSTTIPSAPLILNESVVEVEGTSVHGDLEGYRNVQRVIVTGTAPGGQTALVSFQQRTNEDQIAARAAIEGGTGIHEEIEEITHPTSNDGVELALLGIAYARLRLATSGMPRRTIHCQVRGYGFRGGQFATVNLPTFGLVGTYIVQRVSIREQAGTLLLHDLELTSSSWQRRAYEAWLSVVRGNKVTVQIPSSLANNLQTFNTPGAHAWIVPEGVTSVELTCYGASGGGGGGARFTNISQVPGILYQGGAAPSTVGANGGRGGHSGKAVTVIEVTPGDSLDLTIGSAGLPGANDSRVHDTTQATGTTQSTSASDGTSGSMSFVTHNGNVIAQGNGGAGGAHGTVSVFYDGFTKFYSSTTGTNGADGNGAGDAVSIGGGKTGGTEGKGNPYTSPNAGQDGLVEVRW